MEDEAHKIKPVLWYISEVNEELSFLRKNWLRKHLLMRLMSL
jgi:hypothetical protein